MRNNQTAQVNLKFSPEEKRFLDKYACMENRTLREICREAILERSQYGKKEIAVKWVPNNRKPVTGKSVMADMGADGFIADLVNDLKAAEHGVGLAAKDQPAEPTLSPRGAPAGADICDREVALLATPLHVQSRPVVLVPESTAPVVVG